MNKRSSVRPTIFAPSAPPPGNTANSIMEERPPSSSEKEEAKTQELQQSDSSSSRAGSGAHSGAAEGPKSTMEAGSQEIEDFMQLEVDINPKNVSLGMRYEENGLGILLLVQFLAKMQWNALNECTYDETDDKNMPAGSLDEGDRRKWNAHHFPPIPEIQYLTTAGNSGCEPEASEEPVLKKVQVGDSLLENPIGFQEYQSRVAASLEALTQIYITEGDGGTKWKWKGKKLTGALKLADIEGAAVARKSMARRQSTDLENVVDLKSATKFQLGRYQITQKFSFTVSMAEAMGMRLYEYPCDRHQIQLSFQFNAFKVSKYTNLETGQAFFQLLLSPYKVPSSAHSESSWRPKEFSKKKIKELG